MRPRPDRIFIDHLGLVDALRLLASPRLRHAAAVHSKTASALARRLIGRWLAAIPNHLDECLDGVNYCDLRAHATIELTSLVFESEPNRYLRRWFEQSMAGDIYPSIDLLQDQRLMAGSGGERVEVLLPLGPFRRAMRERFSGPQRVIGWCVGQRGVWLAIRRIGRYLHRVSHALARSLTGAPRSRAATTGRSTLCVPDFRGGTRIDSRHDLFWLGARPASYPILLEYVTQYPVSAEFVGDLAERGARVVTTRIGARVPQGSTVWRPGPVYLRHVGLACGRGIVRFAQTFLGRGRRPAFWKACQAFHFDMLVAERLDFYRALHVRAEVISGFSLVEPAHSEALRELDGVSITVQYTMNADPFGNHTSCSTFHLSLGSTVAASGLPLTADHHLLNGYPFTNAVVVGRQRVEWLRRRLHDLGVRRTVCFLDEGFTSPRYTAGTLAIVTRLVEVILRDPTFGVVLKPKKNASIAVMEREIGEPFRAAFATGRLVTLDWTEYPGVAGAVADLSVGVLGTAPLECAILGCRTIYLSPLGYVPRFMEPVRANVMSTAERIIEVIERLVSGEDDRRVGYHAEEFLRTVDHHRDNRGGERIDWLLSQLLAAIDAGATRDEAVKRTVRGWVARWGADSIVPAGSGAAPSLVQVQE